MASRVAGRLQLAKDVMVSESFAFLASDLKTVSKNIGHTIDSPSTVHRSCFLLTASRSVMSVVPGVTSRYRDAADAVTFPWDAVRFPSSAVKVPQDAVRFLSAVTL